MSWEPNVYLPPDQLAQQEWETQRREGIRNDIIASVGFLLEGLASAAIGQYVLAGSLVVLSVGSQVHAYYLSDFIKPPSQQQPPVE